MHKGYAFVQFTNPFDARNACHGEDGRTILSQVLGKSFIHFNLAILFFLPLICLSRLSKSLPLLIYDVATTFVLA